MSTMADALRAAGVTGVERRAPMPPGSEVIVDDRPFLRSDMPLPDDLAELAKLEARLDEQKIALEAWIAAEKTRVWETGKYADPRTFHGRTVRLKHYKLLKQRIMTRRGELRRTRGMEATKTRDDRLIAELRKYVTPEQWAAARQAVEPEHVSNAVSGT